MSARTETSSHPDPVTLWGRVIDGFQATNKNLHRRIAEVHSLNPAEAEALLRLSRSPEQRMPMAELARQVAFTTGGVTKVADRLAKRGFVQRTSCSDDRRVTYLGLTAEGRTTAHRLRRLVAETMTTTFVDVLGPGRAAGVAEAMAELHQAARERA